MHAGPVIEELLPELQDVDRPGWPQLSDGAPPSPGAASAHIISSQQTVAVPEELLDGNLFGMTFDLALHEEEQEYTELYIYI